MGSVDPKLWKLVGTGNFDGIGSDDILWRNNQSGQIFIWLLNGTQVIGTGSPGHIGQVWQIAGIGDFDGDGRSDILYRNQAPSGLVFMWLIAGTEVAGGGSVGAVDQEWVIEGTGDFGSGL